MSDLDNHISIIDYDLDEMREQQFFVDTQIEKYFKKIESYPPSLKRLYEIGTHLLNQFDAFYNSWYGYQCDLQKFYNCIYSFEQELVVKELSNSISIKQMEKVVLNFHILNEEFLKIKACFNYFKVEIISMN